MPTTKEIFALRKTNLAEAYRLAKQLYESNPADDWTCKAIGWVLYDQLKAALVAKDVAAIQQYSQELAQVPISDDDEILAGQVKRILLQAQPHGQDWQKARELEGVGQFAEALAIFRLIKDSFAGNTAFADSYGWCLYKHIKQSAEANTLQIQAAVNLFKEYLQLSVTKPSNLHSNVLRQMEKLSDKEGFPFYHLFKSWGFESFQPADWEKNVWEGKMYPGLAEKCVQHAGKILLRHGSEEDVRSFQPALDAALQKISDNIWLYYYKAKLLLRVGSREAAETFLKPVVKQKRTEYWAWSLLAEVYSGSAEDKVLSCYCRALLCPADEFFLGKTRLALAELLIKQQCYGEAKVEIDLVTQSKLTQGQNLSESIQQYQQQSWYQQATPKENNRAFYIANKGLAEEVLFQDLPWLSANCGEDYTKPDEPGLTRVKLYFKTTRLEEVSLKDKTYRLTRRFKLGAPVQIKAEPSGERWQVYVVEKREGTFWDCFPEYVAVIDHVNREKKLAHFLVNTRIEGIIRLADRHPWPQEYQVVKLRLKSRLKDGKTIYEVLHWQLTDSRPDEAIYRPFDGTLSVQPGRSFGFVDDIFVDATLLLESGLLDAVQVRVRGNALISYDKKKGKWGWKAIMIKRNE